MVEVIYDGRLGNNLFQYSLGRIIAQQLGYRLQAKPIPYFSRTAEILEGEDYSAYPVEEFRGHVIDLKSVLANKTKRKIVLNGFFQRYEYYKEYKNSIREHLTFDLKLKEEVGPKDILLCIRRRDYVPHHALPLSYYHEALARASYSRVFICTDNAHDWFVRALKKRYNATVRPVRAMDNFAFCLLFKKIIIANSSFHWWAAFLSQAEEIYYPLPYRNAVWGPARPEIDLRVDDEDRYIYIKCQEEYQGTVFERAALRLRRLRHDLKEAGLGV